MWNVLLLHFLLISWVHSGWAASKLELRYPNRKKYEDVKSVENAGQGMLPSCEMKWPRNFPLRKVLTHWLFHHPVETTHFLCFVLFFMDLWTKMFGALYSIRPLNFKIWWHFLASTFPRVWQLQKFYCGVCNVYATHPCCTKELKGNCRYEWCYIAGSYTEIQLTITAICLSHLHAPLYRSKTYYESVEMCYWLDCTDWMFH